MKKPRKSTKPQQTGFNPDRLSSAPDVPDDARAGQPTSGRLGRIQDRALDATVKMLDGTPADRALESTFRRARDLGSSERRAIRDLVYGLARSLRSIDDRLARASKALKRPLDNMEVPMRTRLRILVHRLDQGDSLDELRARDAYAFKRVPKLFERIAKAKPPKDLSIGIRYSLPDWLVDDLVEQFGESRTEQIAETLQARAPLTLRVNPMKMSRDAFIEHIRDARDVEARPTALVPDGVILPEHRHVYGWAEFEEGCFEVQDEGSQLIALALNAQPKEFVVDACAGAGGKTLAIAQAMDGSGRVSAYDLEPQKLAELKKRTRRAGLTNVDTHAMDFGAFGTELTGRADRVLVDAPCSGSGRFRRQPDARWRYSAADVEEFAPLQLRLLLRAIDAVRPGGLIVYATCSLMRTEDERVVEAALSRDRRIRPESWDRVVDPSLELGPAGASMVRVGPGPGEDDPDGFFIAWFRRLES